jgi:hypothetical protein
VRRRASSRPLRAPSERALGAEEGAGSKECGGAAFTGIGPVGETKPRSTGGTRRLTVRSRVANGTCSTERMDERRESSSTATERTPRRDWSVFVTRL